MTARPTILVELGHFRPSLRANGPNRSFVRAAAALSDRFRFRVISEAEEGDPVGVWQELDGLERIALRTGLPFAHGLRRTLRETPHDLIVCNGFFNRSLTLPTLLMKKARRIRSPILLAPRGEFSPGALGLKLARKRTYVGLLRRSGVLRGVSLQATDELEAAHLQRALRPVPVLVGPNVRPIESLPTHLISPVGDPLRIAFLSRIDRKKNLDWAIELLSKSDFPVRFDIFGPRTLEPYWMECQALIAKAPSNVKISYRGEVSPEAVPETLARYDLFLLPTRGENFGHAIADSLLAGTPVLIADTTPWLGLLHQQAGADLPLSEPNRWTAFLRRFAAMSPDERCRWRQGARRFAEQRLDTAGDTDRLAACFRAAMALG